jgi:hypothetical protein
MRHNLSVSLPGPAAKKRRQLLKIAVITFAKGDILVSIMPQSGSHISRLVERCSRGWVPREIEWGLYGI